MLLTSWDQLGL